jgi:predicted nucleotide-binding protein (sugar kinase/HSP70/actin superfamily)
MAYAIDGSARVLVGGLGGSYDALIAAALPRECDAVTLGQLDAAAMRRGRAVLPRGQCAPLLAMTGALLEREGELAGQPATFVGVGSCGPCRYGLFGRAFRGALRDADSLRVLMLGQSLSALQSALGAQVTERVIDALLAADALGQVRRSLWPRVSDQRAWLQRFDASVQDVVSLVRAGQAPLDALRAARTAAAPAVPPHDPTTPRVALIGEPWSLHVEGDAQGGVIRTLCEAGIEVDVPPLGLWLAYRVWEDDPTADVSWLASRYAEACAVLGHRPQPWPNIEELTRLAAPYLPASFRGGYGHLEVGLAARVRALRSAHGVISVKSFGCIPSAGVSDGIVPLVLRDEAEFLSLEISEDGLAARDSRLMLLVAKVRERARAQAAAARAVASW